LASHDVKALRRRESCEDLLRPSSSEEETVAVLGKANLFNKAAHTGVFSDVVFCLLWQNRCCTAASHGYQKERVEAASQWLFEYQRYAKASRNVFAKLHTPPRRVCSVCR
jgi:hypothetical protein